MLKVTTIGLILLFCIPCLAQVDDLNIQFDAQIRLRNEADGRDFNSDTSLNTFSLLRSRFGARLEPAPDVSLYLQLQDSRVYGSAPTTTANTDNVDMFQAFFQVRNLWQKPVSLKIGRQRFDYGNQRILGPIEFSNVGQSFDAALLSVGDLSKLDLLAAIVREGDTPPAGVTPVNVRGVPDRDSRLFGAYYQWRKRDNLQLDAFGLFESDQRETITAGESNLSRFTIGAYGKKSGSQPWDVEGDLALQFGKRGGADISAFLIAATVGYRFDTPAQPRVALGFDLISGMERDDEDYKVFEARYSTNHKFNGLMDFFSDIPTGTNRQGLQDIHLSGELPLDKGASLSATFHNFRAAKGDTKDFGNEFDLLLDYRYNRFLKAQLLLAFFAPGDLMKQIYLNDSVAVYGFLALSASI